MSDTYVAALLVVAMGAFAVRLVAPALPVRRYVVRLSTPDVVVLVVGAAALVLHCGAMFFRESFATLPLGPSVIRIVDPMGTASITWYAVAAAALVFPLRHQHPAVVLVAAAALVAVGYTMYDGGPLHTHLEAIASAVVLLVTSLVVFTDPPWQHRSVVSGASPG